MLFLNDNRGATAILFTLALLPILGLVGASVDFTRANSVETRLQNALDSGALAGANLDSEAAIRPMIETMLNEHMEGQAYSIDLLDLRSDGTIHVRASSDVELTLGRVLGHDKLTVYAESMVGRGSDDNLEIVLVLDNTGSMYHSNLMPRLKTAVHDFLTELRTYQSTPDRVRVGLVTYAANVNIMGSSFDMGWMDLLGQADLHGHQFDESAGQVNIFDLYNAMPNETWRGCVEHRSGGYHVRDAAPVASNPNTLFVPLLQPDYPDHWPEPFDLWNGINNYLPDVVAPTHSSSLNNIHPSDLDIVRSPLKYNGTPAQLSFTDGSSTAPIGPQTQCPSYPIIPLQSDIDLIETTVDSYDFEPGFETPGTDQLLGLMWGWKVLSPQEPYSEGVAYNTAGTRKILVFMTDGSMQLGARAGATNFFTPMNSFYTAAGYAYESRLGGGNGPHNLVNNLRRDLETACDNIKATGIEIYTVMFQTSTTNVDGVLEDCATDGDTHTKTTSASELAEMLGRSLEGTGSGALRLLR